MPEDPSGTGPDDGGGRDEDSADDRYASIARENAPADRRERRPDASIPVDSGDGADDEAGEDGDAYLPEPNATRIESGTPEVENVLFVLLGAVAMVLVIVRLASIFAG